MSPELAAYIEQEQGHAIGGVVTDYIEHRVGFRLLLKHRSDIAAIRSRRAVNR